MLFQGTTATVDEPGSTTLNTDGNNRDEVSVTNSVKDRKIEPRQIQMTCPRPYSKSVVCA